MKIALGSDHRGRNAVAAAVSHLHAAGHEAVVLGPACGDSCDYPDAALAVAQAVADGDADRGVLVCGSGIGMSIAANKVHGVRAALVFDEKQTEMTRRHNDANVLCIAGDATGDTAVVKMLDVFIATPFDGERHARRVEKIAAIERGETPARCG